MSQVLEEKVKAYRDLALQIEQLSHMKKTLGQEILQMLSKDAKSFNIAGYRVQRFIKLSIKTTLEEARSFGATKQEEVIDRKKIKELHALGHPIPQVEWMESISVYDRREQPRP